MVGDFNAFKNIVAQTRPNNVCEYEIIKIPIPRFVQAKKKIKKK